MRETSHIVTSGARVSREIGTMKINVKQTTYAEIDTDGVEFPLYRKNDIGGDGYNCTLYTKIVRAHTHLGFVGFSITHQEYPDESFELETECWNLFCGDSVDEILGRNWYACTPELFERVLARAQLYLESMRTGQRLPAVGLGWPDL